MAQRLFEEIDNWAGGINTAASPDALPLTTSPRGFNTAFVEIAPNPPRAKMAKRRGASEALTAPLTGEPTIIGQYDFHQNSGARTHVLVCGDGSIRKRLTDGTSEIIAEDLFPVSDVVLPAFAVANDVLFFTIGDIALKFDGTDVTKFGMGAPGVETSWSLTAVPGGSGGTMAAGVWDVLITYRNGINSESARSAITTCTITAGQKITVTWTAPGDTQVTHVRLYVRKQAAGANFYRVIAGATPAPDDEIGGFPVTTLSTVLDITDVQYENFILLAPEINENLPPPTGAMSPTWHLSRMFVHDGKGIYWTETEKPEEFNVLDNYEPVNPDDGTQIVALHSIPDKLVINKKRSTYALAGKSPSSWSIEMVSPNIGAVNQQCVQNHGESYWWDIDKGPIVYDGMNSPQRIGIPEIGPSIRAELLLQSAMPLITSVIDDSPARQRVMWAIPDNLDVNRATLILPYNLMLQRWESVGWNPFDVASMAVAEDSSGTPWVFIGGFHGKLFQWWNAANDGLPTDAVAKGNVVSATNNTLTCVGVTGSSPGWPVDSLKEIYVYAISQDDSDVQRKRIASNTADTLTLADTWGSTPNSTYTWVIGGIDFQLDTPWMLGGDAPAIGFYRKRLEKFILQVKSPLSGIIVKVDMYFSYNIMDAEALNALTLLGTTVYAGDTGPGSLYDVARYVAAVQDDAHIRVSRTGTAWRARIRNINPDEEITILRLAMRSVLLSTNR